MQTLYNPDSIQFRLDAIKSRLDICTGIRSDAEESYYFVARETMGVLVNGPQGYHDRCCHFTRRRVQYETTFLGRDLIKVMVEKLAMLQSVSSQGKLQVPTLKKVTLKIFILASAIGICVTSPQNSSSTFIHSRYLNLNEYYYIFLSHKR